MTTQELIEIAGYLTNPLRQAHIELEIPQNRLPNYSILYQAAAGVPFPGLPNDAVYVIPTGGNKWGREMRIYIVCTDPASIPPELDAIATVAGRPGYDIYNKRINNIALIDELIELGFVLGSPQNEIRIRSRIIPASVIDFNNGYNLS